MKIYYCTRQFSKFITTEVQANSKEEAARIAQDSYVNDCELNDQLFHECEVEVEGVL